MEGAANNGFAHPNRSILKSCNQKHASNQFNNGRPSRYGIGMLSKDSGAGIHERFHHTTVFPNQPMNHPIQQLQPTQRVPTSIEQNDAIDLRTYLTFFLDNRWLILGIALAVTLLGAAYAFLAKPVYEANILVQVEDSAGSSQSILGEPQSSAFDLKTAASSEMEILRSRMVVSRAVDNTQLYINVRPKYFPVIGAAIARRNKQLSEPGLLGYGGYVWGSERVDVSIFNVPEELEGASFVLTAGSDNTFRLFQEDEDIGINGRVGETVKVRKGNGEIELRVDRIAANPGAEFFLTRSARLETIEKLQDTLKIQEKGKQSGIIGVTLEGDNPKIINSVLNEIGREYIKQNELRKSEEAEKSLAFLNRQLPDLKQELERSETQYNEFRNRHGVVDLGDEAKTSLQQSVAAQTRLFELKQKKEELLIRFQDEHPAVEAINQQIGAVTAELASVGAKIKKLPGIEQEAIRLSRDVKVNTDLYTSLLSTAQQLRLVSASKVGNIRLLDTPEMPVKPVKPRRLLVVLLAGLLGLILGAICAVAKKIFYGRVNYPHEIEQQLGLPVSAIIPRSENFSLPYAPNQRDAQRKEILALEHDVPPSENVIESLRRFRTSLQFAMAGNDNNIIVITGPTPGVGKSFVSANFAMVLAATGKRVVLIDGDLRTGHLHRYFDLQRKNGLSDVVTATASLDQVLQKEVVKGVDFISTGSLPEKPGELLASEDFVKLLRLLSSRYDFILIDTAPVLAASDALTIGPYAGAVFNIVRAGVSTVEEIEETVKQLNRAGATVTGTVFNDLKLRPARYGYGSKYGKYGYVE